MCIRWKNYPTPAVTAAQRYMNHTGRGGSLLLGSGCIVPRYTPPANLTALVKVAHSHAYPAACLGMSQARRGLFGRVPA